MLHVATCADVLGLSDHLGLATVEGLPAFVVEPAHLLRDSASAVVDPPESAWPSSRAQPALAVIIGHQGAVACGLAADQARLWSGSDRDADVLDTGTMQHFFGPL